MRLAAAAAIAALWILQAPALQPSATDRESAYRANNRGIALLEQFTYDDAARAFREALRLAPSLEIARLNLAIADFYAGRAADAAAGARASATRMPTSPTAHFVVGLIAKAENRADEAAAAFSRVLELDPGDAGTLISLGQIRLQERRYDEALPLFQRALAAEPYNVTAAYNAALALTRAGRADEGRTAMQRFEGLRDSVYGVTYAQTYLAQGRYAEAIASTGAEPELVNAAPPAVRLTPAPGLSEQIGPPSAGPGAVALADLDDDGDVDVIEGGVGGVHVLRNAAGHFTNETARLRIPALSNVTAVVAGDYDNDTRADVFVLTASGRALLHQRSDGTFEEVTAASRIPAPPAAAATAAFADIDHDGDLDILAAGTTLQLSRNNGNGTFTDTTADAKLDRLPGRAIAIAPTDFDNRRDIDVLVATAAGVALFRNMRDGTFKDVAADVGLPVSGRFTALALGDLNKDGYPDIFLGTADGADVAFMSNGAGRFTSSGLSPHDPGVSGALIVDYDNDGLLDIVLCGRAGFGVTRNLGGGRWDSLIGVGWGPRIPSGQSDATPSTSVTAADVDGDGDRDLVVRAADGMLRLWNNDGGDRSRSLRVRLTARVSNRTALGAKIEMRAGSLRQVLETSSSSPAVAPSDIVFGLGARQAADVVRVLWPSGILQAETATAPASGTRQLAIAELDRKPSSCPYLFTWNGRGFEFITDFMGGGEMGGWAGPGIWNQPDPDEYVRIRGDQLQARDGRYELRVTNELEEALFVDRLQLVAVDHPIGLDVYPNEGLRQAPRAPFRLYAVRDRRAPVRAVDEHGHDVLAQLAAVDRRYPDDFARLPIRGYAASHALELDLGPAPEPAVLLLTGWTDYAFSSDSVAASQADATMAAPSLQVKDAAGTWRTVIEDLGFPVGRPQTIAIDLAGKFLSPSRDVRIVTSMRIYWDQVQVASSAREQPKLTRMPPIGANLRWRGFSAEASPDGREPFGYDYQRVSAVSPWKVLAGRYTREGDVRQLVSAVDDMFAISRPGDELALSFDARALPAPAAGWTRTFLLYAYGYSKEMNPRSATPDTVAPLPFRGMTRYPYGGGERFPWTAARQEYDARYNTRVVTRSVPPLTFIDRR